MVIPADLFSVKWMLIVTKNCFHTNTIQYRVESKSLHRPMLNIIIVLDGAIDNISVFRYGRQLKFSFSLVRALQQMEN